MSRYRDHKEACQVFEKIENNPEKYFLIHYSCESFRNIPDGRTPRITSIAIKSIDATKIKQYKIKYTFTEVTMSFPTFLPSILIVCTLLGCIKEEIWFFKFFHPIIILDTLIPPLVLPAQAPININITNITFDNSGQQLKSTVENPVVVTMEDTWKNAC